MIGAIMDYFDLMLQSPLDNIPEWLILIMAFLQIGRMALNLITTALTNSAKIQQGNQAIITQDNTLQSKLLDEMTARRVSDEQLKIRLMDILDEKVTRIDGTTLRIDGTTIATSAEVKAIFMKVDKLDKAMGVFYRQLKKEGVLQ
jgi:hypothetical protein